jgi:cell division septal protein FtsQ
VRNRRRERPVPLLRRVRPALGVGLRLAAGMGLAGLLVLTAGLLARMDLDTLLRIERLQLVGDLRHLHADEVEAVLAGHARGFFVLDLERLRRELEALPWVKTAQLRREVEIIGVGTTTRAYPLPRGMKKGWWSTSSPPCSPSSARWRRPS